MNLAEFESKRGYVVGAGQRLRKKLGLAEVSDAEQVARIEARILFEKPLQSFHEAAVSNFNPQPKGKKK